jgi:hypothetical protein
VGPVVRRIGAGTVTAAGSLALAGSDAWLAGTVNGGSGYATSLLPAGLLSGIGIGVALPALMGAGTAAALPAPWLSTGAAVLTMVRQIGFVLGCRSSSACSAAPSTAAAVRGAFQRGAGC